MAAQHIEHLESEIADAHIVDKINEVVDAVNALQGT